MEVPCRVQAYFSETAAEHLRLSVDHTPGARASRFWFMYSVDYS